ncbi:MAG: HU family DNA-binding protein, partial [Bacteroides sp.]|nr:HU family DNA-binding protein [Bacteroides sp.]
MNNTVTLPQLISLLAAKAGCTPAEARKYLHDLFAQVEEALARGESYTIEGIGEFAPGFEAGNPVLFRPDEALAAALNEPFSAFTAMELPADMPAEALDETPAEPVAEPLPPEEPTVEETPAEEAPVEETPVEEIAAEEVPVEDTPAEEVPAEEVPAEDVPVEEASAEETPVEDASVQDDEEPEAEYVAPAVAQQSRPTAMWLTIGILIGLIVGLVAGYFAGAAVGRYYIPQDEDEYFDDDTVTIAIVEPVQIQQAATAPADT